MYKKSLKSNIAKCSVLHSKKNIREEREVYYQLENIFNLQGVRLLAFAIRPCEAYNISMVILCAREREAKRRDFFRFFLFFLLFPLNVTHILARRVLVRLR